MVNNRKVQTLPDATFKFWVNLLCITKDTQRDGLIPSIEDISFKLRITKKAVERHLKIIRDANLLDTTVIGEELHDWDELQAKSDGDPTARDRKARQREKLRDVTRDINVTSQNVTRTEKSREDKRREREEESAERGGGNILPSPGSARPSLMRPADLEQYSTKEKIKTMFKGIVPQEAQ